MTPLSVNVPALFFVDLVIERATVLNTVSDDGDALPPGSFLTIILDKEKLFPSGIANTSIDEEHIRARTSGGYVKWNGTDLVNLSVSSSSKREPDGIQRSIPFSAIQASIELPVDSFGKQIFYILAKISTLGAPVSETSLKEAFGYIDSDVDILNQMVAKALKDVLMTSYLLDQLRQIAVWDSGTVTDTEYPKFTRNRRPVYIIISGFSILFNITYPFSPESVLVRIDNIPLTIVLDDL